MIKEMKCNTLLGLVLQTAVREITQARRVIKVHLPSIMINFIISMTARAQVEMNGSKAWPIDAIPAASEPTWGHITHAEAACAPSTPSQEQMGDGAPTPISRDTQTQGHINSGASKQPQHAAEAQVTNGFPSTPQMQDHVEHFTRGRRRAPAAWRNEVNRQIWFQPLLIYCSPKMLPWKKHKEDLGSLSVHRSCLLQLRYIQEFYFVPQMPFLSKQAAAFSPISESFPGCLDF